MAPLHLPPEVAGLIFDKVELVRDKLAFLAVCSSWRSSVVRGVHTLVLRSSELAPPAEVAALLDAFLDQAGETTSEAVAAPPNQTTRASLAHEIPGSCASPALTSIALHTGSFTHVSRDLLRAISRHTNLRSLAIGVEAKVLVAPREAPNASDFERLFAHCVRLQDVRLAGSLTLRQGNPPPLEFIVVYSVRNRRFGPQYTERLQRVRRRPQTTYEGQAKLSQQQHLVVAPFHKPNLPRSLGQLQRLTELHLGPDMFGHHGLTTVARLPSLTSLTIPVDLGLPPSAFASLTGLRSLHMLFDGCRHNERGQDFLPFPSSFRLLTRLQCLRLTGTGHLPTISLDFQHAPPSVETLRLHGIGGPQPLANLKHLTTLTRLETEGCRDLLAQGEDLFPTSLQILALDAWRLELKMPPPHDSDGFVLPPRLSQLRMRGLFLDECLALALQLRPSLQSLEVLHLTGVSQFFVGTPGATILPPLPNLVELHLCCRFSLLDKDDGIGLEDRYPALRQLEFIECGCCRSRDVHAEENAAVVNGALAHPCITHLSLSGFHFSTMPPQCSCQRECDTHPFDWQQQQQQQNQQATGCIMAGCSNIKHLSLHGFKTTTVTFCVPLPHLQSLCIASCLRFSTVQPEAHALGALFPSLGHIDVVDCPWFKGKERLVLR